MSKQTSLARRVYGTLLHLYPAGFRRHYQNELTLLFVDMHRTAAAQGRSAQVGLWLTVLPDLAASALKERTQTMTNSKLALIISLILIFPLLFMLTTATLGYEPPFVETYLENADNTPNTYGRIFMIGVLLSVPAAFVINLLPMLRKREAEQEPPATFKLTQTHIVLGSVALLPILVIFTQPIFNELRPFVQSLGVGAVAVQGICLIATLIMPALFLLNRFPQIAAWQPKSANLIVGAAILLVIVMCAGTFALEEVACQFYPNCD